jgi:hypothetical protein
MAGAALVLRHQRDAARRIATGNPWRRFVVAAAGGQQQQAQRCTENTGVAATRHAQALLHAAVSRKAWRGKEEWCRFMTAGSESVGKEWRAVRDGKFCRVFLCRRYGPDKKEENCSVQHACACADAATCTPGRAE